MDIQSMMDEASEREGMIYAKFRLYDVDGTGTIDVVRARHGALSTARAACERARDPASARLGRRALRASP